MQNIILTELKEGRKMANILIDELPKKVGNIDINSDFRISILFELLMQDNELSSEEKVEQALVLYYPNLTAITDYSKAIEDIVWFYRCGKEVNTNDKGSIKNSNKQIYSYEFDAEYIYSAFMEQYNIDLNSIKYLHWWKFKALFNSLNENVLFSKIMSYRVIDLSKIKDKAIKKQYKQLKELYKLPDMRSEEEKENDFAEAFS